MVESDGYNEVYKEANKILKMTQDFVDKGSSDICDFEDYVWYVSLHLANLRVLVDDITDDDAIHYYDNV